MRAATRQFISVAGLSVWLKAELPVLMSRVLRKDNRPLLQEGDPEAKMKALMQERYPVYAEADITVESRDSSHEVVVREIIRELHQRLL